MSAPPRQETDGVGGPLQLTFDEETAPNDDDDELQ